MPRNSDCAYRFTVKRGDSFYLIAQKLGVRLQDLLDANGSIPPARLMVGDVLQIPYCRDAHTPAVENGQLSSGTENGSQGNGSQGNGSQGNGSQEKRQSGKSGSGSLLVSR